MYRLVFINNNGLFFFLDLPHTTNDGQEKDIIIEISEGIELFLGNIHITFCCTSKRPKKLGLNQSLSTN